MERSTQTCLRALRGWRVRSPHGVGQVQGLRAVRDGRLHTATISALHSGILPYTVRFLAITVDFECRQC